MRFPVKMLLMTSLLHCAASASGQESMDGLNQDNSMNTMSDVINTVEWDPCQFGAVYDGRTDCTDAIQECLNRRGTVRLRGNGTALISRSLIIQSDTWLSLDPGFRIRLADGSCCEMLRTRWADQRYFEDEFPDFVTDPAYPRHISPDDKPSDWVLGEAERNIRVTGGIWDANGGSNPRLDYLWGSFGFIGHLMAIVNADNFSLRDVYLFDATTYFFDAALLSNFVIDNIHMDMRALRPNQDGIHLEGECYNGVINNIHGRTWDDMVALNGGDSFYPKYPPGVEVPEEGTGTRILWKSYRQGNIRNIMISNIHVSEGMTGYRAVRLLSTGKYPIDAVTIEGVYGKYNVDGVIISSHYEKESPYGTIILRNINCTVAGGEDEPGRGRRGLIWVDSRAQIDSLMIENCRYRRTAQNGELLFVEGRIRRLFMNNIDVTIADDAPRTGRGLMSSTGSKAVISDTYINNFSLTTDDDSPYDIAFKGNWRRINISNAFIEALKAFDLAEEPTPQISKTNFTQP